ncbi:MAG TPA: ATP-binding protein [Longimicrobiales bacterium]|nr:ATP-binding protein [Longimicrobiales bacterium]
MRPRAAGPRPEREPTRPSASPSLPRRVVDWLAPWLALAALAVWTSSARPWALGLSGLALGAGVLAGRGRRSMAWAAGCVLVLAGVALGFAAHREVDPVRADFESYWAQRDTVVGRMLSQELDRRFDLGDSATVQLAQAWSTYGPDLPVGFLRELRARSAASALALYDPEGRLLLWDGVHRGRVPESVQSGDQYYFYQDFPLFGYLYLTAIAEDGSTAMPAYLLRASLPESLGADAGDFASEFRRAIDERIRVTEEDPGPAAGAVWDLRGRDRLLSVVVERPDADERATLLMDRWAARVTVVVFAAWLLLAVGGPRSPAGASVAAATLLLIASLVPLDHTDVFASLFDPGAFSLPGPITISLGRFTLLAATAFTVVSVLPRPRLHFPWWAAGAITALGFPLLAGWAAAGAAPGALAEGRLGWIAYQMGAAAVLSLVAGAAIATVRPWGGRRWAAAAAVVTALVLGAGGAGWVWTTAEHPLWWTALWGLPAVLATMGAGAWPGWRRGVVGWGLGIVIGSTAAIPVAWAHRVEARMLAGEQRLEGLAAEESPRLEAALLRFAALADSLDQAGVAEVRLLYDSWRASGLADLGQPVWLQVWRRDLSPGEGLRVGVEGEPAPLAAALFETLRSGGTHLLRPDRDDARYILTSRLRDGEVVSVVAPPFATSAARTGLGPLVRGPAPGEPDPLTVIPLYPGEPHDVPDLQWVRTPGGWQAEMALEFTNGTAYHAHYLVSLPGPVLAAARATLLLALDLAVFFGLWAIGQVLVRNIDRRSLPVGLVISFRARVTLALFGFFTLANALFGTIAYRQLALSSRRSAQVIAERVVEDAAGWYRALRGEMDRLAWQVGAELLRYRGGELSEGSVEELVQLGLYEGWTPYEVHRELAGLEVAYAFTESAIGTWEHVTAYRRTPDGDILAAQVPLEAGTTALRTSDLVELLGFVVIIGALLSAALAMLAGRALTRPIHALRVASEGVGAGDLRRMLPADRSDEFGAVFRAFNRMVRGVRRARRQLVRQSRRTQLIMDEAAVGMVALDPSGEVTLVNPRAQELLGGRVVVGRRLPAEGPLGEALEPWLAAFLEGSRDQASAEIQAGERRVRVRARRLAGEKSGARGGRGVVIAMDDVTDELRAERVLAWGEMARQVAHEVKNPLTPIKLSIQHVRRAWEDRHPQFEQILIRNADAMLSEIDRLAGIAQSFSRFGAPGENAEPLTPVSVADVVGEVMALYGGSGAEVRFVEDVEPDLPPVVARGAELKEVLVNLLENARLAGREGTTVSILGRRAEDPHHVLVRVEDDGAGIPEDVLPRIFEPQFSTRSTGTGLGLAIVQRLVRSWGASVDVKSALGEGTVVSLRLRVWKDGRPGTGNGGRE